jgi:Tol biopolymer transport system component
MWILVVGWALQAADPLAPPEDAARELLAALRSYRHKIVHETFRDGNWEIVLRNADGSNPVNLTKTPDIDELYPKVSPDGTKICFIADEGPADSRKRNLYLMNLDGIGRVKIGENARDPCWSPDGKRIAYLKGEFDKFDVTVFATKGVYFYDLETKQTRPHPNAELIHFFVLDWSRDGHWLVTTVHGGMGFRHSILAVEAGGPRYVDLELPGCRPDLSPDGKKIAWGHGDYAIGVADMDFSGPAPKAANIRDVVVSKEPAMTYHVDWSPDGRFLAFTRGPKSTKKALAGTARETPGVQAPGWNLCVADATKKNVWVELSSDGASNKEPDWVFVPEPGK